MGWALNYTMRRREWPPTPANQTADQFRYPLANECERPVTIDDPGSQGNTGVALLLGRGRHLDLRRASYPRCRVEASSGSTPVPTRHSPFHGGNTGSSPVGRASNFNDLKNICASRLSP